MMRRWIKIAKELLKLNNFNAVFEILAGFHSVAVYRLKKSAQGLSPKIRNVLQFLEEVGLLCVFWGGGEGKRCSSLSDCSVIAPSFHVVEFREFSKVSVPLRVENPYSTAGSDLRYVPPLKSAPKSGRGRVPCAKV
jgi:hypothetical protein